MGSAVLAWVPVPSRMAVVGKIGTPAGRNRQSC